MTDWRAVVPIKQGSRGKSRLAPLFDPAQRGDLVRRMADHVLDVLADLPLRVDVLSPVPYAGWAGHWHRDLGRGLNAELAAWRDTVGAGPVLIVHADLPLLHRADVAALVQAAQTHGLALAPDRAGLGTNALAIADGRAMRLCFGHDSCRLHRAQYPCLAVVARDGLMVDLDTPEDAQLLFADAPAFPWEGSPATESGHLVR